MGKRRPAIAPKLELAVMQAGADPYVARTLTPLQEMGTMTLLRL